MGILNVTPDSFSDGGRYDTPEDAVQHGITMARQGATIIDVGGESTRPGAKRVPADEQKQRVVEIIRALSSSCPGVRISIDTTLSTVAEAAVNAGATMLNDISAGRENPAMLELAADFKIPICLMHMQGEPANMQDNPQYRDVIGEVSDFLSGRVEVAVSKGVQRENVIIDPGIGFGKTTAHNLTLLANLDRLVALGQPVLLGTSRKRFISGIGAGDEPTRRVAGSCATTVIGIDAGVRYFRVHDVYEHRQVADLCLAVRAAKDDHSP